MNTKTLIAILTIAGSIAAVFGALFQWQIDNEEWERTQSDWEVFDKGEALQDEYFELSFAFDEEKISIKEYIKKLKDIESRFEAHLEEIDNRRWEEDAIPHRKIMSSYLDIIKQQIQRYSDYL